jgi:outer membrane lipoprotein-sorting protein
MTITCTTATARPPRALYGVLIALIALILAGAAPRAVGAADDATRGLEIARTADARGNGFGDYSATMTMLLRTRSGQEAVRELRFQAMEVDNDGDKSLIVFDQPRDVEGTAVLTHAHKTGDDDIWLYLPSLKRVKRIAGNNKSGPFMGSEFAFEDIGSQELEKYEHRFLHDERFDEQDCHVIERIPTDRNSGYARQEVWLDRTEYRQLRIDYYDRRGELLKTLTPSGYRLHLDRFWFPDRMDMVNHQTGRSTTLTFSQYRFANGYTARDFDQSSLKAAR